MPLSSKQRRERLEADIFRAGSIMAPCTACRKSKPNKDGVKPPCIVSAQSGRCSECSRKGYSKCDVTVSRLEWERLRDNRDKLRDELTTAEDEEERLQQELSERRRRVIRLRKQVRLAEKRTEKAMNQELMDIETQEAAEAALLGDGVEAEDRPPFVDVLEMFPNDWALIDHVGPLIEIPSSQPEVVL